MHISKKKCNFAAIFSKIMKKAFPYIAVIVAMLIWAGSGIAVKAALCSFSPMWLIVLRFTAAVLLMAAVGLVTRQLRPTSMLALQPLAKADIWLFVLAGFFQPFLYFILETYSYQAFATPTIAEAFLSTNPLMAPIFAWLFLRERVTKWNILGIVVSTAGMAVLVLAGSSSFAVGPFYAIPLALVTVATAVAYSILLKRIPAHYNALTIVFWVQLSGLVLFTLLHLLTPHAPFTQVIETVNKQALWGVTYLAILSSVAAFILFCYSVRFLGVTKANVFNNIRPVFTALIMLLLFHEHLPMAKWGGVVIIIIGLFICQKREKK